MTRWIYDGTSIHNNPGNDRHCTDRPRFTGPFDLTRLVWAQESSRSPRRQTGHDMSPCLAWTCSADSRSSSLANSHSARVWALSATAATPLRSWMAIALTCSALDGKETVVTIRKAPISERISIEPVASARKAAISGDVLLNRAAAELARSSLSRAACACSSRRREFAAACGFPFLEFGLDPL